jgi:hypothetical protein
MSCPRCGARSLVRSHSTLACLACGHALIEPAREAWDTVSAPRGAGAHGSPPWTADERALWERP